ncbi:MAG: hypothetical protein KAU06_04735 [Candidatus Marinimicrobia bacterium]|nr:hypothetical protein [Candidatus Neomarinimicrobiota bacterium]
MIATIIKWLCRITGTWNKCNRWHFCHGCRTWQPEHINCRCGIVELKRYEAIIDERTKPKEHKSIVDRQMEISKIVMDEHTIVPDKITEEIVKLSVKKRDMLPDAIDYIENLIYVIDEVRDTLRGKHPEGVTDGQAALNYIEGRYYYCNEAREFIKQKENNEKESEDI